MNVSMRPVKRQDCKSNAIMWAEEKKCRPSVSENKQIHNIHNRLDNRWKVDQMLQSIKNTESYIT